VYARMYELEDRHWWFRGRRAVVRALLGRAGPPPRPGVLDAGCGTGRNLVEFGRLGPATGVDPSPLAVEFCRRRGLDGVVQGQLESLPFEAGRFGVLLATDVLEHVVADGLALAELRRVAAPDARLVITAPAYAWLWSEHDVSHHHVRRYTLGRLRARVRAAGWEPAVQTYFNSLLLPAIAAVRLAGRVRRGGRADLDRSPAALDAVLALPMLAEARAIAAGARLPAGVSVGMACRRVA
jgi:SAM-dependent methyltransferase